MRRFFSAIGTLVGGAALVLTAYGQAPAESQTKVELKRVHMCCEGCSEEVETILKKVAGVKNVTVDQKSKVARFVVRDVTTAQGAIDALAAAGFHGDSGSDKFSFKDDSGVKAGNVKSLTLSGFHNSCGGCVKSFRDAIKDVPGVTGDTLKAKVTTCEIKGDFDAAKLVEAINKGGCHVNVKN
jgi:mercuric ion binding protein